MSKIFQQEPFLITEARVGLCRKANLKTIETTEQLKEKYYYTHKDLSDQLVPECIYRCGCPDPEACAYYETLIDLDPDCASTDMSRRYAAYNKIFWAKRKTNDSNLIKTIVDYGAYAYLKFDHIILVIDKKPLEFKSFGVFSISNDCECFGEEVHLIVHTKHYSFNLRRLEIPVIDGLSKDLYEVVYQVTSVSKR